jgi:hypothetical protein
MNLLDLLKGPRAVPGAVYRAPCAIYMPARVGESRIAVSPYRSECHRERERPGTLLSPVCFSLFPPLCCLFYREGNMAARRARLSILKSDSAANQNAGVILGSHYDWPR